MSFWNQRTREIESEVVPPRLSAGPRTGFAENYTAQRESMEKSFLTSSRANVFSDAYGPIVEALNAELSTGQNRFLDPVAPTPDIRPSEEQRWLRMSENDRADEIWQEIARRRQVDAGALPQIPASREVFEKQVLDNVREVVAEAEGISARATGAGTAGGIVGGMVGAFKDPVNLATLPIGAARAWGILRTAFAEGAINAGVEVATFPGVKQWRDQLGLGYSVEELAQNMAFAAGGGAVIGGGLKTLARVFGPAKDALEADPAKLLDMVRRQLDAESGGGSDTLRGAHAAASRETELADAQPVEAPEPRSAGEHRARVNSALAAADNGDVPDMPARPFNDGVPPADLELHGNLDGVHFRFHPDELNVDAPRFQFKSGGDDAGVTDRLAGLGRWDPVKAGLIVVWEDATGARFIADGHQRLALAKRLIADDPNVRLYGFLLREGDGVTAANAREIAAIKNIAEGSGSAVDAAKILRVNPERLAELPLTSGLVRVARDLVNLEDAAFMMVVNELVPVNYAALVGRLAGDRPEIQGQILGVLARLGPDNATQAESIVRQAIEAGTTRETQVSLFGEEDLAISLFAERALVLDRALKKLRRDRTVFNTLVGDKTKIEEAGNKLAGDVNAQRAKTDAEAIQTLQKLAHRKGPLSDALNAAAERARSGDVAGAVDDFVQRTRTLAADGTLARLDDGAGARGGDAESQAGGRPPPDPVLRADEDFSEPAGSGQAAQADRLEAEIRGEIDRAGDQVPDNWPDDVPRKVFRGVGRDDQGAVYSGAAVPILGEGRYYAFDEGAAREFGPVVERVEIDLENPLVIRSDDEWRALAKEAGWRFPNPSGLEEAEIRQMTARLRELAQERGHDGVVVFWNDRAPGDIDAAGRGIKTLRNVFGTPQVVDYRAAGGRQAEGAAVAADFEAKLRETRFTGKPAVTGPDGRGWRIKKEGEGFIVMQMANVKGHPPRYIRPPGGTRWTEDQAVARALEEAGAVEAGGQRVLPGAERISDKELAERGMEGKAKPKAPQQEDIGGIFDVNARGQIDLADMDVPTAARLDDAGELVIESRKAQDLLDDIEAENDFVDALDLVCGPKGGKA